MIIGGIVDSGTRNGNLRNDGSLARNCGYQEGYGKDFFGLWIISATYISRNHGYQGQCGYRGIQESFRQQGPSGGTSVYQENGFERLLVCNLVTTKITGYQRIFERLVIKVYHGKFGHYGLPEGLRMPGFRALGFLKRLRVLTLPGGGLWIPMLQGELRIPRATKRALGTKTTRTHAARRTSSTNGY
ncbi:hypothetical protein GWI33_017193 [Rhynchophorus ferrugineus]|uniref:Uncharacterized protein n=1 Tax=Rhynchophorus ferrugineus TaxID=354439 RepID=A0A834M2L9_RHYFE|nr:hypothetical protein GWI33_017193 [Rhynchophorus ferrugineus]